MQKIYTIVYELNTGERIDIYRTTNEKDFDRKRKSLLEKLSEFDAQNNLDYYSEQEGLIDFGAETKMFDDAKK